jgi:hypothetical protein
MNNNKLRLAAFALVFAGITSSAQAGEGTFGWIYTLDLQQKARWSSSNGCNTTADKRKANTICGKAAQKSNMASVKIFRLPAISTPAT